MCTAQLELSTLTDGINSITVTGVSNSNIVLILLANTKFIANLYLDYMDIGWVVFGNVSASIHVHMMGCFRELIMPVYMYI